MLRAIGLMSGTSMDGVDIAFIETDGESRVNIGPSGFFPYSAADRAVLRAALEAARDLKARADRPPAVAAAEILINERHAQAVENFRAAHQIDRVDLVGFHGQTVLHRPDQKLTVQIGDGPALARRLKTLTVYDFRAADMAAGGQGAPLVPIYHQALARAAGFKEPTALLNIGGVANITYIPVIGDPIACDTGPGAALIDDLMLRATGEPMDRDGAMASSGRVDRALLNRWLDDSYFRAAPPKSLDRGHFAKLDLGALSLSDAAAILTHFTAAAAMRVFEHISIPPARVIVCGGGARNRALMAALRAYAPASCPVETAEDHNWSIDAMEAQAFAYLAARALRKLPLTFPSTTGAPHPMSGGVIATP